MRGKKISVDKTVLRGFYADTFWRQDSLAPDVVAPRRFGAKHIFDWDIRLWETFAVIP